MDLAKQYFSFLRLAGGGSPVFYENTTTGLDSFFGFFQAFCNSCGCIRENAADSFSAANSFRGCVGDNPVDLFLRARISAALSPTQPRFSFVPPFPRQSEATFILFRAATGLRNLGKSLSDAGQSLRNQGNKGRKQGQDISEQGNNPRKQGKPISDQGHRAIQPGNPSRQPGQTLCDQSQSFRRHEIMPRDHAKSISLSTHN